MLMPKPPAKGGLNNTYSRVLSVVSELKTRPNSAALWEMLLNILQTGSQEHWNTTGEAILHLCLDDDSIQDSNVKVVSYKVLYFMCLSSNYFCSQSVKNGAVALLTHAIYGTISDCQLLRAVSQNIVLRMVTSILEPSAALELLNERVMYAEGRLKSADFVKFFTWASDAATPSDISSSWVYNFMTALGSRFHSETTFNQRRYLLLIRRMREKFGGSFWSIASDILNTRILTI